MITAIKRFDPLIQFTLMLAGGMASIVIFLFLNFAQIKYVDAKFEDAEKDRGAKYIEAIKHSDRNRADMEQLIRLQQDVLNRIDQRTYEMNGQRGPRPEKL